MHLRMLSRALKCEADIVGLGDLIHGLRVQLFVGLYVRGSKGWTYPGGRSICQVRPINNAPAVAHLNATFWTYMDGLQYLA